MKFFELKQKIYKCMHGMPSGVTTIHGQFLPPVRKCENYMMLAGRAIMLHNMPKYIPHDKHQDYWKAHTTLQNLYSMNIQAEEYRLYEQYRDIPEDALDELLQKRREEWYNRYYGLFCDAYEVLLREEAKLGCVRVPAKYRRLRKDTFVTSYYTSKQINYSPMLTQAYSFETNTIRETAKIFAKALLQHQACGVISVQMHRPLRETEYAAAQTQMHRICDVYNLFLTEEFEKKQTKEPYRHREDDDPSIW